MILGILSDTHGKADITATAVRCLLDHGAEYLIHCGDIGSESVLDQMAGHPALFVFGNTDWDRPSLSRYAKDLGIVCGGTEGRLAFGGKRIIVTHGDDDSIVRRVIKDQQTEYLLVGHTHYRSDHRQGNVRLINPGALYRAAEKTVAVLDTVTDTLKFHVLNPTA